MTSYEIALEQFTRLRCFADRFNGKYRMTVTWPNATIFSGDYRPTTMLICQVEHEDFEECKDLARAQIEKRLKELEKGKEKK